MNKQLDMKQCGPSKCGVMEYLTFLRKPQAIYQMSAEMATKHCKKLKLEYRYCSTVGIKRYFFGLIGFIKVEYRHG